ncbi:Inositol 1,4,5-trisphosphate receptor 1 isoform [Oopsacas minuta]|uniref:Inositol 1,4,5-trisphosphate receptor n=1 Tax=Oopsacas minuta TaxID=111878 RepID=A0AAV7JYY9_9METZ|nr:Inositol 1,4,5-trisphosphate receptor 1 isoform [Oopsacas minuta]
METDNAPLKIGDIISLISTSEPGSNLFKEGHLASLGLVDERCAVKHLYEKPTCPPDKFSDCLFKIYPQLKYTARSQCERSERISSKNTNVVELAYYLKWKKAAELEETQNEKQAQKDQGKILKYGSVCQLLHMKSGKFLTVNKQQAAFVEKTAMRVSLNAKGSENCWLHIRPIFKRKALGDEVLNCDKVTLMPYHANQPIHVSDKHLNDYPDLFEVNAMSSQQGALNGVSWKLYLFMDHFDDKEVNLKGGSVIRLFHAEQEKFLTCDPHGEGEEYKKAKDFDKKKLGHSVFLRYSARPNPTEATSSKAMWEAQLVQLGQPFRSGSAKWNGSLMRFKHLASREYLTVVPFGLACENPAFKQLDDDGPRPIHIEDSTEQTEYVLTIGLQRAPYFRLDARRDKKPGELKERLDEISDELEDQTLFQIYPTRNEGDNDSIYNKAYIRLYHVATNSWVKSTSIPLCVNNTMVGLSKSLEDKEAFALLFVPTQEVRDLDFATDAAKMIHSMSTRWEELLPNELKILIQLLEKLVLFLCGKEGSTDDALKVELIQNESVQRRQKLIREQNILKEIFRLLKRPYDINQDKRVQMKNLPEKKFEGSLHLFKLCYRLIRHSLDGYRKNQEYVAKDFFWFMQQQLGKGINAEETMAHLVKQNAKVLDIYMGHEQINMFLDLLNKYKHARYLQHLCALCVMKNSDTPISRSVQKLVKSNLLDKPIQNMLIKIIYEDDDNEMDGRFQLKVPWNESMDRIGQKELCERKSDSKYSRVYEYWKWQLELYSSLCYGRHYSAIDHPSLKEQLTIQTVFQCMKDTDLPLSLRAVYCKLLQTMYLDVNPQTLISPIEYARLWQDIPQEIGLVITRNSKLMKEVPELLEDEIQDNENDTLVYDCLMETTEYIKKELSREVCMLGCSLEQDQFIFELVHTAEMLVKFGFYSFDKLLNLTDTLLGLIEKNMIDVGSQKECEIAKEQIEQKEMVQTTYLEVLKIIDFVMNLRLDIRLSIILVLFKNKYTQKGHKEGAILPEDHLDMITEVDKYFQSKSCKILSLDDESGKKLVKVLLFLITEGKISKEEKLIKRIKEESLSILFRHFNQREEFIHAFKQIQMLVSEPDREDYLKIKDALENLKKFLDRKSLSLSDDYKEGGRVTRGHSMRGLSIRVEDSLMHNPEMILLRLSNLCHEDTSRRVHVQRLLRNLGSHRSVLNLIEMAIKEKNVSSESIIIEAHRFLQKFCRGNENNQKLLYQDIKMLLNTDNAVEESNTLRSIFENNEDLCMKVTEDIIQKFISAIEKESVPNMAYLHFFQTVVKVQNKCIVKNQDIIMNTLMSSDDVLKLCNDEKSLQMLEESMYRNNEDLLRGYKYHLNLIKLIALCVEGRNGHTILKCQSIITLEDLAKVLCNSSITNAEVKKEYANLLLHAYVIFDPDLINKKTLWTILQYFIYDIAMVFKHTEPGGLSAQEAHRKTYVMDFIVPIVSTFSSGYANNTQRRLSQPKHSEIFIQLIQHIAQLLASKNLYPDFSDAQWVAVQNCLEVIHKLSKEWIAVFPPELDAVVNEAVQNIKQLFVVRKMVRSTTGSKLTKRKQTIDKSQDIECTISAFTNHLEAELSPLIDVDTFVLIACLIHPADLFPPDLPITETMKNRQHINALMDIAENCAKSNEYLCLSTLKTLREYIETPYLGICEFDSEEEMNKKEKLCNLARQQCMIYFCTRDYRKRRLSQSLPDEESNPVQRLFDYHYTEDVDDINSRPMIIARQCDLNSQRISQLVIYLVRNSMKKESSQIALFNESLRLGIALLNGGNREVQKSLNSYFQVFPMDEFFVSVKKCIDKAQIEIKNSAMQAGQQDPAYRPKSVVGMCDLTQLTESTLTELSCMKTVLRYLQLLCENHDISMQRFLRVSTPSMVKETIQFLESICGGTTAGLGLISAYINKDNESLLIQCLETLTEYCQGPCNENQDCIASPDTLAIDLISSLIVSDIDTPRNLDVRSTAITTLLAVMESRDETDISDKILLRMRKENLISMIQKLRGDANTLEDNEENQERREQLNNTGHSLYILAHQLSQHQRPLAELIKRESEKEEKESLKNTNNSGLSYFAQNTSSIEIVRQDSDKIRMERIVFPKPEICNHLDEQTKIAFLKNARADNKGSRVDYFFKEFEHLYSIMENKQRLKTSDWRVYITNRIGTWSDFKFSFALIINMILALYYPFDKTEIDVWRWLLVWLGLGGYLTASGYFGSERKSLRYAFTFLSFFSLTLILTIGYFSMRTVLLILGLLQIIDASVFFLSYLGNHGGLYTDSNFWKTQEKPDKEFYYHCIYLAICILGFFIHPFFCCLLLFDIVHRETTLQNVIRSVTKNWFSIMLTFILALILIYIFSILGYLFFQDDYWVLYDPLGCADGSLSDCDDVDKSEKTCESLFFCVLTTLWQGMRQGGGIGDVLKKSSKDDQPHYYLRIIYDMAFFFLIIVITLNLILGVIVDTFANLRSIQSEQEDILNNSCFICGLKRSNFDKKAVKFEAHISKEHNVWHYLQFRAYLKEKSHTEYTGPESYVQNQIDQESTEWFPWLRAMSLRKTEDENEVEQTEFQEIKKVLGQLAIKLDEVSDRCSGLENKFFDRSGTISRPQHTWRLANNTKNFKNMMSQTLKPAKK